MKRWLLAAALLLPAPLLAQGGTRPAEVEDAVVRAVQRGSANADVYLLEEPREVSPGRWIAFASRTPAAPAQPPTLHACVTALVSTGLVASCILLPTPGASRGEEPFAAESIVVADLDADGSPEVRGHVNYQGMWVRPGVGSDFDHMYVVDVAPRARLALDVETRRYAEATTRTVRRTVAFSDENGDGHDDAVVEETVCTETETGNERCTPARTSTLLWSARTGTWLRAAAGRRP